MPVSRAIFLLLCPASQRRSTSFTSIMGSSPVGHDFLLTATSAVRHSVTVLFHRSPNPPGGISLQKLVRRRRHDPAKISNDSSRPSRWWRHDPANWQFLCRYQRIHLCGEALGAKELGALELFQRGLASLRIVVAFVHVDAARPEQGSEPVLGASRFASGHVVGAHGFAQYREATGRFDHPPRPRAGAKLLGQM